MFKKGDYVTRESYGNDILFEIVEIKDNNIFLKGVDYRLVADANINDLKKCEQFVRNDNDYIKKNKRIIDLDRDNYFYIPGKILHIDGDKNYLDRCLDYYKEIGVNAVGYSMNENEISDKIPTYLNKVKPNIVVITGHDAYLKKRIGSKDLYKNSKYFISAVNKVRKYESDIDNIVVIAGACQSDYLGLITAGANYASSPMKINIHALDPAIIASNIALCDKSEYIDIVDLLTKTNSGKEGMGGIKTRGTMLVGFPRNGDK